MSMEIQNRYPIPTVPKPSKVERERDRKAPPKRDNQKVPPEQGEEDSDHIDTYA